MTLTPNPYGNNPFQPGVVQDAFIPDQLIGGDMKIVTDTKLITGGAYYKRGTVLGRINTGSATSAVKASGANTGNGSFVLDATTPILANADSGVYTLRFTSATNARLSAAAPYQCDVGTVTTAGASGKCFMLLSMTLPSLATSLLGLVLTPYGNAAAMTVMVVARQ